jgi:hypothetical protein
MEYTLAEEDIYKGFKLTIIEFNKNSIRIVYTTDYYDTDGYWEEYYSIGENSFVKIIERISTKYEPFLLMNLDTNTAEIYDSIEKENCKLLFLYILSIKENHQKIHGDKLVSILCGDEIEYERNIYSKGP